LKNSPGGQTHFARSLAKQLSKLAVKIKNVTIAEGFSDDLDRQLRFTQQGRGPADAFAKNILP